MCTCPYLILSYIILHYVTIPYITLDYLTLLHYLALLCIALHNIHGGRSKYVSQNCAKLLFRWGPHSLLHLKLAFSKNKVTSQGASGLVSCR